MEFLKVKFWVNLILVIGTTYIITWYLLTPSNNQCQMTFMMEPPKFLPVPVDGVDNKGDATLSYPNIDIKGSKKKDSNYKLYMYSEFGFPQASNVRRDLKDSMPVLFVPGNAGSYQQVRSLASTCIRHQLQSLDAFKFIFYTIDFRGELSGISGQLIEEQTSFVQKSLEQIAKMHPTETNGIILIGHSVGGFISKVLFTMPSFDPNSVPLLISLASPLTGPYLTFDQKMRELYRRTNHYWGVKESRGNSTIAISISGGKQDRLVPMHLSMDPHYDLSLTTSSIKDVWLTTDHVCITWCKELMHKLSHLLSALMDKRQTRLISNRNLAMSIIKKELLIDMNQEGNHVIQKDWKSVRSHKIMEFEGYFSETRSRLGDSIILLKLNRYTTQNILIIIDYIETLKENGIFGCLDMNLNTDNGHINCSGKIDLMQSAQVIPSRRFEPKRQAIKLVYSESNPIRYIVMDFLGYTANGYSNHIERKLPEMLTVQKLKSASTTETIYIPTVVEYLFKRLFFMDLFYYKISAQPAFSLVYQKYQIINLKQKTQIYTINFKSHSCTERNHPNGATIIFSQGGYLIETFHPATSDNELSVDIKLASQQTVRFDPQSNNDQSYLDMYIDGTCENSLNIKLDVLALVVDLLQRSLGKIMTCTTMFAYLALISSAFKLTDNRQVNKFNSLLASNPSVTGISSFMLIYSTSDHLLEGYEKNQHDNYLDQFVSIILIFILSHGVLAFLEYFIKRVIDLAIIINNAQSLIRQKVSPTKLVTDQTKTATTGSQAANGYSKDVKILKNSVKTDFDWLLITVAITGGFMFCPAFMSLFTLFIVIKQKLSLDVVRSIELNDITCDPTGNNKHCCQDPVVKKPATYNLDHVHNLMINMAVFSVLALISTIPKALIRINSSNKLTSIEDVLNLFQKDMGFLAIAYTLITVKVICEVVDTKFINASNITNKLDSTVKRKLFVGPLYSFLKLFSTKHLHLLTLTPIVMIELNICHMIYAFTILMAWLSGYLLRMNDFDTLVDRKHKRMEK